MGGAQALALVPGVSRSGATLSMGRALGYDREAATRSAFLLAIPAVFASGLFSLCGMFLLLCSVSAFTSWEKSRADKRRPYERSLDVQT